MKIGFQPLHDKVLIQRKEADKQIGKIFVPDTVDNKPSFGTVLAVGKGMIMNDGSIRKISVDIGDMVMFEKYSGFEIEMDLMDVNGKKAEFVVVKEEEILGVIRG